MWRPADPDVVRRIVCDQKQKFIRRANRVFVTDDAFLRMKQEQLVERYTPIVYTIPSSMKRIDMGVMRTMCTPLESLTVIELRKLAHEKGVKGYYKYTKSDLIQSILRKT